LFFHHEFCVKKLNASKNQHGTSQNPSNNFRALDAKIDYLYTIFKSTKLVIISKENTTRPYVNKTQSICYKSLEIALGKFVKLLGIASAIAIIIVGSYFLLFHGVSKFILMAKRLGPWMVL
jgi:hypothetical protein